MIKTSYYNEHDWKERWSDIDPFFIGGDTDTVLDIGCAEGLIAQNISPMVSAVVGIDTRLEAIEQARKTVLDNVMYNCCSIEHWEWSTCFDIILCLGVLHKPSIQNKERVLEKIFKHARKQVIIRTKGIDYNIILNVAFGSNFDVLCPATCNVGRLFICNRVGV